MRWCCVSLRKVHVCYCDVFSLAYVYFDQLELYVVCVEGLGYVYVCESYVVLDQCDESPSLFVLLCLCVWWCSGVFFGVLAFCVSFVSCIVMSGWVLCTRFLSSSILFLMPFLLIWSMTMFLSFSWSLSVSGWVVICLRWVVVLLLRFVWVCVYSTSPVRLYCRCFICVQFRWTQCVWLHLIEVCCFFICLWQRSQIHMTGACLFVCVVGPGFDSTSPAFVGSRASHAAGSDGRLAQKRNRAPISGDRVVLTQFVQMSVAFQPRSGCVFLEHLSCIYQHYQF